MDPAKSGNMLKLAMFYSLLVALVVLAVFAVLVRHTLVIRLHPFRFVAETVLVALLGSLPVYFIAANRAASMKATTLGFVFLAAKFASFFVLMELAGVNTILFPSRSIV